MTLIVAAQGADFMVLGADSRETVDVGVIRVETNIAEKLIRLTDHAAVLLCGEAGYAQHLVAKYQARISGAAELGVTDLTEGFASFCQAEAIRLSNVPTFSFHSPTYQYFPDIGFILGGLNKIGTGFSEPRCYGLSSQRGYRLELGGNGFVLDGKPMIARYLFARYYQPNMDIQNLSKLVARCLFDTARVDGDVGGQWKLAIIEPTAIRVKSHEEVEQIIENEELRW